MILFDEYRCAELDGLTRWRIYRECAAANMGSLLKNGDVERDSGREGVLLEVVCR